MNLFKAISESNIKESLEVIILESCGITDSKAEKIIKGLGMNNVYVGEQFHKDLDNNKFHFHFFQSKFILI